MRGHSVLKPSGDVTIRITALVATLMLGGMTCAYAQGGPPEEGAVVLSADHRALKTAAPPTPVGLRKPRRSKARRSRPRVTAENPPRRVRPKNRRATVASLRSGAAKLAQRKRSPIRSARPSPKTVLAAAVNRARRIRKTRPISRPTKAIRRTLPRSLPARPASKRIAKRVTPQAKDTQKTAGEKTATDSAKRVDLTGDKRTRVQAALRSKGDIKRRTGVSITYSRRYALTARLGVRARPARCGRHRP